MTEVLASHPTRPPLLRTTLDRPGSGPLLDACRPTRWRPWLDAGSLLPVREIYADFLLERGQVRAALAAYEQCRALNPGRLNSLYGAGLASERSGERDTARKRYAELAAMVSPDADRPEIAHARAYLAHARAYLADAGSPSAGRTAQATTEER